ncbi:MAG: nucleotidyltransferase domain-containing protein, partial [Bdellovibrionales bacterium]
MGVIIWPNPKSDLTRMDREKILALLVQKIHGRVEAAYLFGSYANQTHRHDSDIDIVLIKETDIAFTKRNLEFSDLLDIYTNMDILVYTPDEFSKILAQADG